MTRLPAPPAAILCAAVGAASLGCAPPAGRQLCDAIAARDVAAVRRVLSEHALDVNAAQEGCMPAAAVFAVATPQDGALTAIGVELVKAGLRPDVSWVPADGGPRTFAIEPAAAHGNIELVRALLAVGLDVKQPEVRRALLEAAANGRLAVVKLLVAEGADVDRSSDGDSPRARARANGHTEVAAFLDDPAARTPPNP